MAIAGKGVKGKEALHVFLNFERGLSFRGLSFRGLRSQVFVFEVLVFETPPLVFECAGRIRPLKVAIEDN